MHIHHTHIRIYMPRWHTGVGSTWLRWCHVIMPTKPRSSISLGNLSGGARSISCLTTPLHEGPHRTGGGGGQGARSTPCNLHTHAPMRRYDLHGVPHCALLHSLNQLLQLRRRHCFVMSTPCGSFKDCGGGNLDSFFFISVFWQMPSNPPVIQFSNK